MESFEGESVKQVAGGNQFTCAVTVQGSVFCWGPNYDGRTGVGTTNGESKYPTRVKGLTGKKVESISCWWLSCLCYYFWRSRKCIAGKK